ncbi:hypothetical protein H072_3838 [Dactylellina haptotyla CBS 200.50]|uniref:BTB domain-containing protein n=1 Tax=Dactylellina haptotyla (strain CBS 200.50) TaxID=1284197 RepID=S8C373_DACHA|nr:hypothetical protein H072_3838 [Dactylellina haptotyla CBS 200.50]
MGEPTGTDPMVEFEEMIAKDYSFNGFPKLLNNPAFSDLTLHVGNPPKEYRVHRNILCERSSYFTAVCNGNFQESQTREINLPEQNPQVFEILLKYLYTGHFDDKDSPLEIIDTLLEAADYFDIENFKELVVQKVWKKLHDDSSSGATDREKILDVGYLSGLFGELCKISFDERKIAILAKAFLKKGNLEQWLAGANTYNKYP